MKLEKKNSMLATPARVLYSHPHFEASTRMLAIEPAIPLHTMSDSIRGSVDPQNPFASHHLPGSICSGYEWSTSQPLPSFSLSSLSESAVDGTWGGPISAPYTHKRTWLEGNEKVGERTSNFKHTYMTARSLFLPYHITYQKRKAVMSSIV